MFWWSLVLVVLATPFLVYGLLRWASSHEGIDRELSKERFRAEQELRGLRRSGRGDLAASPPTDKV